MKYMKYYFAVQDIKIISLKVHDIPSFVCGETSE